MDLPRRRHLGRAVVVLAAATLLGCTSEAPVVPPTKDEVIPPGSVADTIPPSQITGIDLAYDRPQRRITIRWPAPHDNEPTERVDHYEMRYSFTRGVVPQYFSNLAMEVTDPPAPRDPGGTQTYVLDGAAPGKDFFVGIRALDADGNVSPSSDIATMYVPGLRFVGRCTDVLSGAPVSGLAVRLSAAQVYDLVTDANGEFVQDDILSGAVQVDIDMGNSGVDYHSLSQLFVAGEDTEQDFAMVPYQPTVLPESNGMSVLGLVAFLLREAGGATVLTKWHRYPVPVYIPPLVNSNGFDYKQNALAAMQRWNDRSGRLLFEFVDAPPDTGIIFHYPPRSGPGAGVTFHTFGDDGHPMRDDIEIVNDLATSPYITMLHELGHTIRFGHMHDRVFIMYGGQPLPQDISDDEAAAANLHGALPTRVDLSNYDTSAPGPAPAATRTSP